MAGSRGTVSVTGDGAAAVSVLIVNHNSGAHLRRCLERLRGLAEEWPAEAGRLEAVVVDNASTDGSADAVREPEPRVAGRLRRQRARRPAHRHAVGEPEPRVAGRLRRQRATRPAHRHAGRRLSGAAASALPVRLIASERNLGFGAACNLAVRETTGRYLLLLNPDAWTDAASLRRLAAALEADSRLGAAAPALRYPDGSPQLGWAPEVGVVGEAIRKFRNRFEGAAWNHRVLPRLLRPFVGPGWFSAACLLVRRSAFEEVGGFDEGFFLYFEDADLGLRLAREGWRQRRAEGARAWHVRGVATGRPGTRRLSPEVERFYRASQLRCYDLHRPRWERAYLRRRLRRKFRRVADEEEKAALLRLLEPV